MKSKTVIVRAACHRLLVVISTVIAFVPFSHAAEPVTAREKLAASATSVRRQAARSPHSFREIEVFDVASPQTVAGAGFLVRTGDKTLAVTAGHPHPKATPTKFTGKRHDITLGEKLGARDDIVWFAVDAPKVPAFQLMRKEGCILKKDDAVAVVCQDRVLSGKLTRIELGTDDVLLPGQPVHGLLQLWISGRHDFMGTSGSPVILEETGEVIGVLLSALDLGEKTAVEFALLTIDPPSQPLIPAPPISVFSLASRSHESSRMETFFSSMLPSGLFEIIPGTPMMSILEKRPFLPSKSSPDFTGYSYSERLDLDYLFNSASFNVEEGKLRKLSLGGGKPTPSASRVEALFDWFLVTLGEPSGAFAFDKAKVKAIHGSVYCKWTGTKAVVVLGAQSPSRGEIRLHLSVVAPDIALTKLFDMPRTSPLPTTVDTLRAEVRKLVRETATLAVGTTSQALP